MSAFKNKLLRIIKPEKSLSRTGLWVSAPVFRQGLRFLGKRLYLDSNLGKMNPDLKKLIDNMLPFAQGLFESKGEFFPFGCAVNNNGDIVQVNAFDGDDFPLSEVVIKNLRSELKRGNENYCSAAIFYDVKVSNEIHEKVDAVAIFLEAKDDTKGYTFYYPSILSQNRVQFLDAWYNHAEREVF